MLLSTQIQCFNPVRASGAPLLVFASSSHSAGHLSSKPLPSDCFCSCCGLCRRSRPKTISFQPRLRRTWSASSATWRQTVPATARRSLKGLAFGISQSSWLGGHRYGAWRCYGVPEKSVYAHLEAVELVGSLVLIAWTALIVADTHFPPTFAAFSCPSRQHCRECLPRTRQFSSDYAPWLVAEVKHKREGSAYHTFISFQHVLCRGLPPAGRPCASNPRCDAASHRRQVGGAIRTAGSQ